LTYCSLCI